MKQKIAGLLILWTTCIISNGFAQLTPSTYFSKTALRKDLEVLKQAVTEAHPGYGRFSDKRVFDQEFNRIYDNLPEQLTLEAFFKQTNPLIATINCGHTKYHPAFSTMRSYPYYFNPAKVFPLQVMIRNNKFFTLSNGPEVEIPAASEIIAINGQTTEEILSILKNNQFADGQVESSKNRDIEENFASCYSNFIGNPDQFVIEYRSGDKITKTTLTGITGSQWNTLKKNTPRILTSQNNLKFVNDSTAVLRLAEFNSDKKDIQTFIKNSFKNIHAQPVKHLVIDLRGNQGGFDRLGAILYAHIAKESFRYYNRIEVKAEKPKQFTFRDHASFNKLSWIFKYVISKKGDEYHWTRHYNLHERKPAKFAYQNKVYFLMDGASYSVSAEFLARAKFQNRGIFIGEEAGGAYAGNNSGTFAFVTLPNTKMVLAIPLGGYYMNVSSQHPAAKGVAPDFAIEPTPQETLNRKDAVLDFTLLKIKQQ